MPTFVCLPMSVWLPMLACVCPYLRCPRLVCVPRVPGAHEHWGRPKLVLRISELCSLLWFVSNTRQPNPFEHMWTILWGSAACVGRIPRDRGTTNDTERPGESVVRSTTPSTKAGRTASARRLGGLSAPPSGRFGFSERQSVLLKLRERP